MITETCQGRTWRGLGVLGPGLVARSIGLVIVQLGQVGGVRGRYIGGADILLAMSFGEGRVR